MSLGVLDKYFLERLQKKAIYKDDEKLSIIGNGEARRITGLPKEIMRPVVNDWEKEGIAKERKGSLLISPFWRDKGGCLYTSSRGSV